MTLKTPPKTTVNEREAAAYVGYSRHYLRLARRTGRGPAYIKTGRSIRYTIADLDAWQDEHRVDPRERPSPSGALAP